MPTHAWPRLSHKQGKMPWTRAGKDQRVDGEHNPYDGCQWSASGGSISQSGVFAVPEEPGVYTVTASHEGDHHAKVTVVAPTGGDVAQAQGEKERVFECKSDAGGHPGAKIPKFARPAPPC